MRTHADEFGSDAADGQAAAHMRPSGHRDEPADRRELGQVQDDADAGSDPAAGRTAAR